MKPHDSALAREQYAATHQREYRLFWALDDDGDGHVRKSDLTQALENNGLTRKDVRLVDFFSKLDGLESDVLDFPAFLGMVQTPMLEPCPRLGPPAPAGARPRSGSGRTSGT